jgi:ATP-dependent exoDNAse (exonuclease V) beta subunit
LIKPQLNFLFKSEYRLFLWLLRILPLAKHHEGQAEYPIQTYYQGEFQNVVIDRTFVDENNVRWIIDYKLTNESKENKTAYAQQLNRYALLLQQFDSRPIRLGLYFPLIGEWDEIKFSLPPATSIFHSPMLSLQSCVPIAQTDCDL